MISAVLNEVRLFRVKLFVVQARKYINFRHILVLVLAPFLTSCLSEFYGPQMFGFSAKSPQILELTELKRALSQVPGIVPGKALDIQPATETADFRLDFSEPSFSQPGGLAGGINFVGARSKGTGMLWVQAMNKTTWTWHDDGKAKAVCRAVYEVLYENFPDLPNPRDVPELKSVWPLALGNAN